MIAAARERVRSRPSSGGLFSPLPPDVTEEYIQPIVIETFGIPQPDLQDTKGKSPQETPTGGSVM
jgi:hypothetical protein